MSEKVLVTGAYGFLGKYIVESLKKANFHVLTLGRSQGEYISDLSKIIPIFKDEFSMVVHAAGKAHIVPKKKSESEDFYNVNVIGTKNLLSALEQSHIPSLFIFISSVSVYGVNAGNEINEESATMAKDPYGKSKILSEDLIEIWCLKNDVKYIILRLPLIIGENAPGNLSRMVKAIQKGTYFNIGKGDARKSMVLASDIGDLIAKLKGESGRYNLTDGLHPSFSELSHAIAKKNGKSVFYLPMWPFKMLAKFGDIFHTFPFNTATFSKMTLDLTFNDKKARKLLNWEPKSVIQTIEKNNF